MSNGGMSPDSLEIARRESRAVLDIQISTARTKEVESLQTIRSAGIVLGILVAAAGIVGSERLVRIPPVALAFFILGALMLLVSMYFGYSVVSNSFLSYGIEHRHRKSAVNRDLRSDYIKELLQGYDGWISEMHQTSEIQSRFLLLTNLSLIGGIVSVTLGGGVILISSIL